MNMNDMPFFNNGGSNNNNNNTNNKSTNWNDIQDKPFGDSTVSITWDGDTANRDVLEISYRDTVYQKLYKVSDFTATYDELKSDDYTLNGSFISATGEVVTKLRCDTTGLAMATDNCNGNAHFIIVNELSFNMSDGIPASQTAPSTGIYFSEAGTFTHSGVKKIEEKFIPNVFVKNTEKGQPDGIASLGLDGKIPAEQIPKIESDILWFKAEFDVNSSSGNLFLSNDITKEEILAEVQNGKLIMLDITINSGNMYMASATCPLYFYGNDSRIIINFNLYDGTNVEYYYSVSNLTELLGGSCTLQKYEMLTENSTNIATEEYVDSKIEELTQTLESQLDTIIVEQNNYINGDK